MTFPTPKTEQYRNVLFTVFTCVLFVAIIAAERAPAFLSIAMIGQLLSVILFTKPVRLWQNFYHNKAFFYFSFCYLFLLLSLFYSSNMHYLLERLQIKIPLLLYALVIPSIGTLSQVQKKSIFYSFIACITVSASGI
jgi:CDP-diglyceride synthetase